MTFFPAARAGIVLTGIVLSGLALGVHALPARAAAQKTAQVGKKVPRKAPPAKPAATTPNAVDQGPGPRSADAGRVTAWIAASGDNHGLPYAVIDKKTAALELFDAQGKSLGRVPVLLGIAPGDEASPGIGSKNLSEIGPAEKTTPAGRFLARFGVAAGNHRVLWVDYATSVALHPIPTPGKPKERRRERMLSLTSEDNRISFGCINVPLGFYTKTITPLFRGKGGYVYVMPDVKPLEEVFPRIRMQPFTVAPAG